VFILSKLSSSLQPFPKRLALPNINPSLGIGLLEKVYQLKRWR
jgi:hypothetical protein